MLLFLMVWDLSALHSENRIDAERYTAKYASDAQQRIQQQCGGLQGSPLTDCIREEIQATHENQRAEADLNAQRDMANWAWAMAIVSGLGVTVTGVGVVYVALTLREARETTRAAIEGADHARIAAEEARAANELARSEAERQFAPYLFVLEATCSNRPPDTLPPPPLDYWVKIAIKNGSNWTAFVTQRHSQIFNFAIAPPFSGNGMGSMGQTSELLPGEVLTLEFGGDNVIGPQAVCFFGIKIVYDSVDGRERHMDLWYQKGRGATNGESWWLSPLDGMPQQIADLPASMRGPWGSGYREMTQDELEEEERYYAPRH